MRVTDHVYRISDLAEWDATRARGELAWSALDRRDGFVHLSSAHQVGPTLARYFAGREDLVLLTLACDRLVEGSLRFEPPVGRALELGEQDPAGWFPHFYGRVGVEAIVASEPLACAPEGVHLLPPTLLAEAERDREDLDPISIRIAWDPRRRYALIEYPKPVRIEDEAGIYAWEAQLERRLGPILAGSGDERIPAVVGLDNLWVAPKLERRYAELVDKVVTRWFSTVARWTRDAEPRGFFARVNAARSLPHSIFDQREDAVAFVLDASASGMLVPTGAHEDAP